MFPLWRTRIIACLTLVLSVVAQADTFDVPSTSAQFRDLVFQSHRGLPRLGVVDLGEAASQHNPATVDTNQLRSHAALARQTTLLLEQQNHSLGLWIRLQQMRELQECFAEMQEYAPLVERCAGQLVEHRSQGQFWYTYQQMMAYAMTPKTHSQAFCYGKPGCAVEDLRKVYQVQSGVRPTLLDEFQRRDFYQRLLQQYQAEFEQYWRDVPLPTQAYWVVTVNLSDYNFNQQAFHFRLDFNRPFEAQNPPEPVGKYITDTALNARNWRVSTHYEPTLPFEQALATKRGNSKPNIELTLPMDADQARQLVEEGNRSRVVFAVLKVAILPKKMEAQDATLAEMNQLSFHVMENNVTLYQDSGLTDVIASLPLVTKSDNPMQEASDSLPYQVEDDALLITPRILTILRLAQGDWLPSVKSALARAIPQAELDIWRQLWQRENLAEVPMRTAHHSTQQEQIRMQYLVTQDAAKSQLLSWQQRTQLEPSQQQNLLRYLLGLSQPQETAMSWPEDLPVVDWGMNIATIFSRERYRDDERIATSLSDEEMQQVADLMRSGRALLQHKKWMLSYSLDRAEYDPQRGKLQPQLFRSGLTELSPALFQFVPEPHAELEKGGFAVPSNLQKHVLWLTNLKQVPVGDIDYSAGKPSCELNPIHRSQDCRTSFSAFDAAGASPLLLALDRQLTLPDIDVPAHKIDYHARTHRYQSWQVLIELTEPELVVSPFVVVRRNEKKPGETQIIKANVANVILLDPAGQVYWQQKGDAFVDAATVTQLTNPDALAQIQIPEVLEAIPAWADFIYARYYPEQITDNFIDASMSSRWEYEQRVDHPVVGRFFASQTPPKASQVPELRAEYRAWFDAVVRQLPDRIRLSLNLRYSPSNVTVRGNCMAVYPKPGEPLRDPIAQQKADKAVRQCHSDIAQAQQQVERCAELVQREQALADQLAQAKAQNCGLSTTEKNSQESETLSNADGLCPIPAGTSTNELGPLVQQCMTDKCGVPNPANITQFQQCAREIQAEMQTYLQQMFKASPSRFVEKSNRCEPLENDLRQVKRDYERLQCERPKEFADDNHCQALGLVDAVSDYPIGLLDYAAIGNCGETRAFNRSHRDSAKLLSGNIPLRSANLTLQLITDDLTVPYDLPSGAQNRNQVAQVVLQITGIAESSEPSQIRLFTKALKVTLDNPN